jgi:hypothetical protein
MEKTTASNCPVRLVDARLLDRPSREGGSPPVLARISDLTTVLSHHHVLYSIEFSKRSPSRMLKWVVRRRARGTAVGLSPQMGNWSSWSSWSSRRGAGWHCRAGIHGWQRLVDASWLTLVRLSRLTSVRGNFKTLHCKVCLEVSDIGWVTDVLGRLAVA